MEKQGLLERAINFLEKNKITEIPAALYGIQYEYNSKKGNPKYSNIEIKSKPIGWEERIMKEII